MEEIMLSPNEIALAHERIRTHINQTPVLESEVINNKYGHRFLFKMESLQKTGSFKLRGALNTILNLREQGNLPAHVVAFSSGNHAQGVAYAAKLFGVKATILIPEFASAKKIEATRSHGAEVVLTRTRQEAEAKAKEMEAAGAHYIHPYDNDMIICGQGTACYEALKSGIKPDAIFATCGGGGWLSGSYLARELLAPKAEIYGCEPQMGNDAAQSYRSGSIVKLADTPMTVADGARTLAVSERTFKYLKKLNGFYEVAEDDILKLTAEVNQGLKQIIEPTSAVSFGGALEWAKAQEPGKTILVLISGGNV